MGETGGAWCRLGATVYAKNDEEADALYTKWVKTYDDDVMNKLGCDTLKDNLLKKTIECIHNDETATILDLAAGTGIAAERLQKYGYKGTVDAVERNIAMMDEAKKKGMYRKYISFNIIPEDSIPVEDGTYDAVTIIGALGPNHLKPGCLKPAVRCLKTGGVISFYTRKTEERRQYVAEVEKNISELVAVGEISPIEVKEVPHYDTKNVINAVDVINAMFYVYRKL